MAKQTSIEDCLERIEAAISDLESDELPLEQALGRYEEGLKHVKLARGALDRFAARLELLRQPDNDAEGADGAPG